MPNDLNALLPASVVVTFPRSGPGAGTAALFPYAVTLASLALAEFQGAAGVPGAVQVFHDTALASFAVAGDSAPSNDAELLALARQVARDFYRHLAARHDVVLAGAQPWQPEGLTGLIEWRHENGAFVTRARHGPWTDSGAELLHRGSAGAAAPTGNVTFASGQGAIFEAGSFLEILLGAVLKVSGALNIQPGALIHWPYFDHLDVITGVCVERAGDGSISDIIVEKKRLYLPPFLKKPTPQGCHTVTAFGCCDEVSGSGSGSDLAIACTPCVADCSKCIDTGAPSCWTFTTSGFTGEKFLFNGNFTLQYASGCTWDYSSDDVQWTLSWAEDSEQWLLSGVDPVTGGERVYYVLGPLAFECLANNTMLLDNDLTAGSGDVEDAITLSPVANDCFTGPTVDVPCYPAPVPETLHSTMGGSACTDVNGVSNVWTYGGLDGLGNHFWTSDVFPLIAGTNLTLTCRHDLGDTWTVQGVTNGCVSDTFTFASVTGTNSSNIVLVFDGTSSVLPSCPTCNTPFTLQLIFTI